MIFLSCQVQGQEKKDHSKDSLYTLSDAGFYVPIRGNPKDTLGSRDTIPIKLLLCYDESYAGHAFMVKGYEVRRVVDYQWYVMDRDGWKLKPIYGHLYYLDERKKPLPKNIYVWLSKED